MKRYEKYKPSRIEWIGEVPEHWEECRLKSLLKEKLMYGANESAETDNPDFPRYIRITDITDDGKLKDETFKSLNPISAAPYLLKKGDLLFARSGSVGRTFLFDSDIQACFAGYLIKAAFNNTVIPRYVYYFTQSGLYWSWISSINIQTTIQNIGAEKYNNMPFIRPTLEEQMVMVTYLDARCGDIDKVVATQEKRIALLNEMKQSIITQAVTRGLNPDAKMKDSGVEWIGLVPEHWDVMPFKSKFKTDKGLSITKADLVDEGVPVISYGQIHSKQNDYVHTLDQLLRFIPEELIPADSKAKLEIGDIVFADTSEDVEGSGNAFYIEREGVYAGYHTVIAKSIEHVDNKYFAYLFATPIWRSQVRSQVYGVKVYSITQQILKATSLIVPSPEEQKQIVEVLEEKCARIDRQIDNIQNEIELLREYKQSLITDVVTGKVKVC